MHVYTPVQLPLQLKGVTVKKRNSTIFFYQEKLFQLELGFNIIQCIYIVNKIQTIRLNKMNTIDSKLLKLSFKDIYDTK